MMLPLFDSASSRTAETWPPSIGDGEPTDAVRDAAVVIASARIVRTVEPTGHPLDVNDWRAPVIGDTLWHDAGRLPSGDGFAYWLVCVLS